MKLSWAVPLGLTATLPLPILAGNAVMALAHSTALAVTLGLRLQQLRRNAQRRAHRRFQKWLAELDAKDVDVHVSACPSCESTQLCRPECDLAPWNRDA